MPLRAYRCTNSQFKSSSTSPFFNPNCYIKILQSAALIYLTYSTSFVETAIFDLAVFLALSILNRLRTNFIRRFVVTFRTAEIYIDLW